MTKIDIVSGFLGAGKTTLIKKLLKEALGGEQVVLIENEFGEIGIDGGFLKDAGIEIKEMNSGCICCSLVGDFGASLKEVLATYAPERIIIEPSGVGKLSDVMAAVKDATDAAAVELNSAVAVVDAKKAKMYLKNFGEFFANQIEHAGTVVLSRTDALTEEKIAEVTALVRAQNEKATIITTPWQNLTGAQILNAIEGAEDLEKELMEEALRLHEHGADCTCGCHDHDHAHHHDRHHHDHHADEIFTSFGMETPITYTKAEITHICAEFAHEDEYGMILRAKGMVAGENGEWIYFDYTPGEVDVRTGSPDVTGKFCVIGSDLNEGALRALFAKH